MGEPAPLGSDTSGQEEQGAGLPQGTNGTAKPGGIAVAQL